jgi:NADH-quinone oxidoreductase subunit L
VGIPASLGGTNMIEHWLDPVFEPAHSLLTLHGNEVVAAEYILMALSVAVAVSGLALAWQWYARRQEVPARLKEALPRLYRLLLNKYFVDEAYDVTVVNPVVKGSEKLLWKGVDAGLIDGAVNGLARLTAALSRTLRLVQTGVTDRYIFIFLLGVVLILGWLLAG